MLKIGLDILTSYRNFKNMYVYLKENKMVLFEIP